MKNECFQKGFWWFYDKIQKVSTIKTQQPFYLGHGEFTLYDVYNIIYIIIKTYDENNLDFDDGKYNLENWTAGQQIIYLVSGPNCLGVWGISEELGLLLDRHLIFGCRHLTLIRFQYDGF